MSLVTENADENIENYTNFFPVYIKSETEGLPSPTSEATTNYIESEDSASHSNEPTISQIKSDNSHETDNDNSNFESQNLVKGEFGPNEVLKTSIKQETNELFSEYYINTPTSSTFNDFTEEQYEIDHFLTAPSIVKPDYIKPEDIKSELEDYLNQDQIADSFEPCEPTRKKRVKDKKLICYACPYRGRDKHDVAEHFKIAHMHDDIMFCPKCNFKTKWLRSLTRHVSNHISNNTEGNSQDSKVKEEINEGFSYQSVDENDIDGAKPEFVSVKDIQFELQNGVQSIKTNETKNSTIIYDAYERNMDRSVCIICKYRGLNMAQIEVHYKTVHMRDGMMFCSNCDFKSKWKRALARHVVLHDKNLCYQCPHCSFNTKQKAYFRLHIKSRHEEADKFYCCEHCSFKTKHMGALWRHTRLQHTQCSKYKCSECNYETKRNDHLRLHIESQHSDCMHECSNCNFRTKIKYDLKKHIVKRHTPKGLKSVKNEDVECQKE